MDFGPCGRKAVWQWKGSGVLEEFERDKRPSTALFGCGKDARYDELDRKRRCSRIGWLIGIANQIANSKFPVLCNGVRNVVIFQIKKYIIASIDKPSDQNWTGTCEQLLADFQATLLRVKLFHQLHGAGFIREIECDNYFGVRHRHCNSLQKV